MERRTANTDRDGESPQNGTKPAFKICLDEDPSMTEDFDDVRDALDALVEGRVSAERVREEFGDVDGIGYSISVAVARREQDVDDAEWEFELNWPESDETDERERLAEIADRELRDELERITDEIEKWRSEYDVETPDELRASIGEEMDHGEREHRREVAYDWEHNLYTRGLILDVLGGWEYDVREKTGDESDPRAREVIDRMLERAGQTRPLELVDEEVAELVDEYGEEAVCRCAWDIFQGNGTFRMCGRDHFDSPYYGVVVGTSLTECLRRMRD